MKSVPTIDELKRRAKKYNSEPYWFGLGFIQLKLSDTERMHFWTPDCPHPEREEIHNHRYDFASTVLAGTLKHDIYHLDAVVEASVKPNGEPASCAFKTEWEIFETDCAPNKEGTVEKVSPAIVTHVGTFTLAAGSTYSFPHESFHTTEGTKFAVTSLTRVLPKPIDYASVIKKAGAATTCPFKEKLPLGRCWDLVEYAVQLATNWR
jgi:hypothetical protein